MSLKPKIRLNSYFHALFLLWVVVGGVLLFMFDKRQLFTFVNEHYSGPTDVLMVWVTHMGQTDVILPVLLLLMWNRRLRTVWYFITGLCCLMVPFFIQQGLKRYFHYPRPIQFYDHATWIHKLPNWPELLRDSFPSGHSQGALSFFCFASLLLPPRYQWVGIIFFLLGLSVCYSRLYLAAHFFSDVYFGSIIGVVLTTLIFNLMVRFWPKKAIAS